MSGSSQQTGIGLNNFADEDVVSINGFLFESKSLKAEFEKACSVMAYAMMDSFGKNTLTVNIGRDAPNKGYPIHSTKWLESGVECKLLEASSSSGWLKGKLKLRMSMEFTPDEVDVSETTEILNNKAQNSGCSLDELRQFNQTMNR